MAKQHQVFLSGTFANTILYERDGQHYARSSPSNVRQSKATRTAGKQFGEASRISTALRSGLGVALPDRNKNKLRNRLISPLYQWVRSEKQSGKNTDLPFITGFGFNPETAISERLNKQPLIDWKPGAIVVSFLLSNPTKDISAPAGTSKVYFQLAATSFPIRDTTKTGGSYITEFNIDYSAGDASRKIEIPFGVKKGELAVVMLSIKYETKKIVQDKRWQPSGIIGSCFVNDAKKTG